MGWPYRADQVGSFLRPTEILDARKRGAGAGELKEIEDRHILRVLQKQADLGYRVFSDGEFRRGGFMSDFHESVDGLDVQAAVARAWKSDQDLPANVVNRLGGVVVRKIRQKKRLTQHEADFLKRHSPGNIKMTLPSANQFPAIAYKKGVSDQAYKTYSEFLWDIVPIIRSEIAALAEEGIPYIQVDAPRYAYYIDPKWRQYVKDQMGLDPEQALDEAIRVDNECFRAARGRGSVAAIHLCRGNNRSQWFAEGGYDPIAEKVFGQLEVDAFLLEYESERAGTFEPLRFVPKGKTVVLGLVSSKRAELETQEDLLKRIDEAARYVPIDHLALSPQCGFASVLEGNLLTEEQQWSKLALVTDTARRIWG